MKKPWYKRWWIWVITVLLTLSIGACSSSMNETEDKIKTPTNENEIVITKPTHTELKESEIPSKEETKPLENNNQEETKNIEPETTVPPITETTSPIIETEPPVSIYYVCITPYGNKYHKSTCRHISDSETTVIEITQAQNNGYEACKTCKP